MDSDYSEEDGSCGGKAPLPTSCPCSVERTLNPNY